MKKAASSVYPRRMLLLIQALAAVALLTAPRLTLAGGSVELEELRELLQARQQEWADLQSVYEIAPAGDAGRFGREWQHLAGGRIGPYEFRARKRNAPTGFTHRLVIETAMTFFDSEGRALRGDPDPAKAANFKETIASFRVVRAAEPATGSIKVDFAKKTVDGIDMAARGKILLARLGPQRVSETTEALEGDPHRVYVVSFGDKKVYRHWSSFSFSDPAIRTAEGLGTGSTIAEFEQVYGKGEVFADEGYQVVFGGRSPLFSVKFTGEGNVERNYRSFRVTEIYVPAPEDLP